ncbi:hypothetical protein MASR2M64_18170 [Candidatus Cloacimonadota bacterium]
MLMNYQPIIDFIRGLYPNRDFIPLHEPHFAGNEKKYMLDCIDTTFVSSVGKYVDKFEEMIREFTGAKYAVATVNGTAALHIALLLAGVQRNDLVITQPLTFIATCNAISYCGAEPVFIDIDRKTLGLSAEALESWLSENSVIAEKDGMLQSYYLPQISTNERSQILTNTSLYIGKKETNEELQKSLENSLVSNTQNKLSQTAKPSFVPICDLSFVKIRGLKRISACVPMHTFGQPCEIERIVEVCKRYHIPVVEDSAESIGSYYKGQHTGTFGKLGVLSFNGNKTITTGGGGMIITNDDELGKLAKPITTTAKIPHPWKFEHDMVGYNYCLSNINAALGCAQMELLPGILKNKRQTAHRYQEYFQDNPDIEFMAEPKDSISNYWLNAILLKNQAERDIFLQQTNDNRVMTRPAWILMNQLEMFQNSIRSDLKVSIEIANRLINIPSSYRR